jgi:hypothetical protein
LILDPAAYSETALADLVREFSEGLRDLRATVDAPEGKVLDPASLVAARELLDAALRRMDPVATADRVVLAAQVNLGYATMIATIDLVKSHTDVPRVPQPRPATSEPGKRSPGAQGAGAA